MANLSACLCMIFLLFGCLVGLTLFVITKALIKCTPNLCWLWIAINLYLWFWSSLYFISRDVHYIYINAYLIALSTYQYSLWSTSHGENVYNCICKKMNIAL